MKLQEHQAALKAGAVHRAELQTSQAQASTLRWEVQELRMKLRDVEASMVAAKGVMEKQGRSREVTATQLDAEVREQAAELQQILEQVQLARRAATEGERSLQAVQGTNKEL